MCTHQDMLHNVMHDPLEVKGHVPDPLVLGHVPDPLLPGHALMNSHIW